MPEATSGRARSERAVRCAATTLAAGEDEPWKVGAFTDEELHALDGLSADQMVPMPWWQDRLPTDDGAQDLAASVALRGLIARGLVIPAELLAESIEDLGDDPQRLYAVDAVEGMLTLRRAFTQVTILQRQVSEQLHTIVLYSYGDSSPLVEEEITADGFHHFAVLPRETAVDHVVFLVDQDGAAATDGDPVTVATSEISRQPELDRTLSDTRALTVATTIAGTDSTEQITFYATSDAVLASVPAAETDHADGAEPTIEIAQISSSTLREFARELLRTRKDG